MHGQVARGADVLALRVAGSVQLKKSLIDQTRREQHGESESRNDRT